MNRSISSLCVLFLKLIRTFSVNNKGRSARKLFHFFLVVPMFDQQIEAAARKLVQLVDCIEKSFCQKQMDPSVPLLYSDYARQLASLFHLLIGQWIEERHVNMSTTTEFGFDPLEYWYSLQSSIDRLNSLKNDDARTVSQHISKINSYIYHLLYHLKVVRTVGMNLRKKYSFLSIGLSTDPI